MKIEYRQPSVERLEIKPISKLAFRKVHRVCNVHAFWDILRGLINPLAKFSENHDESQKRGGEGMDPPKLTEKVKK